MSKSVLVTGASSGIGKAIALKLAQEGYKVFAGIRKKNDKYKVEKLHKNIVGVYLDVTNASSIDKAFWFVLKQTETLEAIINNAGIAVGGPMEFMPIKRLKEQFEVNTFGAVAVAQKFLPMLSYGRIINISSDSSTGLFPFLGPYCASKRSLDILFNCLQLEMNQNHVTVISIKPGAIKTPIWDKSIKASLDSFKELPGKCLDIYKKELNFLEKNVYDSNENGIDPEVVADVVFKALKAKKPKSSYTVGFDAFLAIQLAKLPLGLSNFLVKIYLNKKINR